MIEYPPITKRDKEIAIKVLMQSRAVQKWVTAQANFLMIKPDTPEWDRFFIRAARKAASKLIR